MTAVSMLGLQVELSQDDLKVLLRILMENLGEAGSLEPSPPRQEAGLQVRAAGGPSAGVSDRNRSDRFTMTYIHM